MKTLLSKSFVSLVMMSSFVGLSANAAPQNLLTNATVEVQTASFQPSEPARGPLNLLANGGQTETCDSTQSEKVCEVRIAAARRAAEVIAAETGGVRRVPSMGLLIPVGLVPVKAVACEPSLTIKECEQLNRVPSVPPGPLSPCRRRLLSPCRRRRAWVSCRRSTRCPRRRRRRLPQILKASSSRRRPVTATW